MRLRPRFTTALAPLAIGLAWACCACCALSGRDCPPEGIDRAANTIEAAGLLDDVRALSDDSFEGRSPGGAGEDLTVDYLSKRFAEAGAQPGNPDGTWIQHVPLVGIETRAGAHFDVGAERMDLALLEDFVAVTHHTVSKVEVDDSQIVFVGYGVRAPEYDWDDFEGMDLRGKTLLMLVGDPPVPDPADAARLDPELFRGPAMTYYGRWTYKYEIASELGAAAAIVVHQTGPAGYPWEVVSGSWGRENFDVRSPDGNADRVPVESWVTEDVARRLVGACGEDFDALQRAALSRDFRPVALDARASFELDVKLRDVMSHNVAAKVPGAGLRADEWLVYSAHWDHLGVDPARAGDQVFNGAVDNATGTAALLALARAFSSLESPPARSILLLAVTAEEKGLLGSKHYASSPLYPLERTVANINLDAMNPWGRTRDVVSIGFGQTTLEDVLVAEAARQGRVVVPDPEPEKGSFYRSDHFEFAKLGVPALYADAGVDYVGRPAGWGEQRRDRYTAEEYHKPADEVQDDWDLSGLVEDVRLFFRVGLRVANDPAWPTWKPGTEFKAVRERMLAGS